MPPHQILLVSMASLLATAVAFSPSAFMIGSPLRGASSFSKAPRQCPSAASAFQRAAMRPFPLRMAATLDAGAAGAVGVDEPKYISKAEAIELERELLEEGGFSRTELIEMGGHAVADTIFEMYPPSSLGGKKVVVLCGKGTNGGYGLVAARYLHHYGYSVIVVYPDRERGEGGIIVQPHNGLEKQLRNLDMKIYSSLPGFVDQCALLVDSIYGLEYAGRPPAPWDVMFKQMLDPAQFGTIPLLSVDLPSCWDADIGPPTQPVADPNDPDAPPPVPIPVMYPDSLISLTAPKRGVIGSHVGPHYLGVRPLPFNIKLKYGLNTPPYAGTRTYTRLTDMTEDQVAALEASIAREESLSTAPAAPAAVAVATAGLTADIPQDIAVPFPPEWGPPDPAPAAAAAGSYKYGAYQYGQDDPIQQQQNMVNKMLMPPMPDEATDEALESITEDLVGFINAKNPYWQLEVRNVISSRAVPIGEETSWPPYRTTVAKLCYVAAKAIIESGRPALDLLPEAQKFATIAFQDDGDVAAGNILKSTAELYGFDEEDEEGQKLKREILELVDKVSKERRLGKDLEEEEEEEDELPPKPKYKITDKWSISIVSPKSVGDPEPVDIVVRPVQKARMLVKAWLQTMEMDEDQMDEVGLEILSEPVTWRSGVIDLDEPIGESGVEDNGEVHVFFKEERAAELTAKMAKKADDSEESEE